MTSEVKLRANGAYVVELKNGDGTVVGKAGPKNDSGPPAESGWIHVHHGHAYTVVERGATDEENAAAKAAAEQAQTDKTGDGEA